MLPVNRLRIVAGAVPRRVSGGAIMPRRFALRNAEQSSAVCRTAELEYSEVQLLIFR